MLPKKSLLKKALIVANEPVYEKVFKDHPFVVDISQNYPMSFDEQPLYDLILFDARLVPLEKIEELKKAQTKALLISLVPDQLVDQARRLIENQILFHFIPLPFPLETLENSVKKAINHLHVSSKLEEPLVAESPWMKHFLKDVECIAKSHSSVFLSGESGTGKEMLAHFIHSHSPRAHFPFIKVNCAAIPATLLESEFFGHEKGAFTGAIQKKLGRFELAHQGTLLLDEISEISLDLQPKLLRVIQEMEFERVGGTKPIQVNVRLISTSNRSMQELLDQKLFREDLFYRLNVIPIHIPPLREHREDILPLAEHFLKTLSLEHNLPLKTLSEEAKAFLISYSWPGNIRELANVLERALVMHTCPIIQKEHFRLDVGHKPSSSPFPKGLTLQEMEKQLILQTLKEYQNHRSQTAKALGISIRTLRNKLNAYGHQE